MRKTREILRLRIDHELSNRAIGRACSISHNSVEEYLRRFICSGLPWPLPEELDDSTIQNKLFPDRPSHEDADRTGRMPDLKYLHRELRRPCVTLYMLWQEYQTENPDGYRKSQFYYHYRTWAKKLNLTMRQEHKAGEKVFVDYAGKKPKIVNPKTGEQHEVELFIGCLGASSYTYAEATYTQQLPDWISSHIRMFEFFGCVPFLAVPDNLKSGVTRACRYEPDLNPTYQDLADHYGIAIIAARKRKPKDKAKVEAAVRVAERMIIGLLRNHTFFSLEELNVAIAIILDQLNGKPFQKLEVSRRDLFEQLDRPAMNPLPARRYEYGEWRKVKVHIDYHVEADQNYYSVHYSMVQKRVDIRQTYTTIEIWYLGKRLASHLRSYAKGKFFTHDAHRPHAHREYLKWTPERIMAWAEKTGGLTAKLMEKIMESKRHPEQGYRSCLGVLRLAEKYTPERLEKACTRAVFFQGYSYKSVKSILENKLDTLPLPEQPLSTHQPSPIHENIRGAAYYATNPFEKEVIHHEV